MPENIATSGVALPCLRLVSEVPLRMHLSSLCVNLNAYFWDSFDTQFLWFGRSQIIVISFSLKKKFFLTLWA